MLFSLHAKIANLLLANVLLIKTTITLVLMYARLPTLRDKNISHSNFSYVVCNIEAKKSNRFGHHKKPSDIYEERHSP